jgi:hypothetical protein
MNEENLLGCVLCLAFGVLLAGYVVVSILVFHQTPLPGGIGSR